MEYDISIIKKIQEKRDGIRKERKISTSEKDDLEIFSQVLHRHLFGSTT